MKSTGAALLRSLGSLKFTVALLALSMALIFAGTLAQVSMGIGQAVEAYFRSSVAWVELQLFVPESLGRVTGAVPLPGGLSLGLLLMVNLIAAHAVRFRLSRKRIGIITLHAGLIVLLAGEFVAGAAAREGLMSIDVGGSSRFVEDVRTSELVVAWPPGADEEEGQVREITIPQEMLERAAREHKRIRLHERPVEIEVERWMPNARLLHAHEAEPAMRGVGRGAVAEELPTVRGVDGMRPDAPAAVVSLFENGALLGTWLVWTNLIDAQRVQSGESDLQIALRYARTEKPYTLHLIEFRHDRFVGTEMARNFSSRVRIDDPARGTDREVLISMNNPLRYRGATFYQASYKPDGTGTVLQVVRNPGATLPYIACTMVASGLALHLVMSLSTYLRRRGAAERKTAALAASAVEPAAARGAGEKSAAVIAALACALGLVIAGHALLRPAPRTDFDLARFASLPVSSGGRVKPMDTAARHALLVAGGRQSIGAGQERLSAAEFMLGLMAAPETIGDKPVVRVDHPDLLTLLGREAGKPARLSLNQIEPKWTEISEQAARAFALEPRQRDAFERAVIELHERVNTLLGHARMLWPYVIAPLDEAQEWESFHTALMDAPPAGRTRDGPESGALDPATLHPSLAYYIAMMTAASQGDAAGFNRAVGGYDALLRRDLPGVMRRADLEVLFNRASLFVGTAAVYVLAFVLACAALMLRARAGGAGVSGPEAAATAAARLRLAAVSLMWTGLIVHTLAIAMRIYLQARPPVTNLYSSAVFVGWAAVLFGLVLERLHALGIAVLGAAAIGFATLLVAHHLGTDGDTMQMMQAVLDSNFWLATHVVTITLGYSATFLAGVLGIVYLLMGVLTRHLSPERGRALGRMVYGSVCFALLLSFVGTVLGGIWADQSWGRFWGWDPKENGAALVVLINAIILHARWGGLVRLRGIMLLAVGGNIVTAWSWFGTNMLGVGLHSYGFVDSAVFWLMVFVVSQMAIIAVGLTPERRWRSGPGV